MRGVQLGGAIGARVTSDPTPADFGWAELIVLVKKGGLRFAHAARSYRVPIIWDAVDCWRQPFDNGLGPASAVRLLQTHAAASGASLVIGATMAQARAIDGVYLPHHSWQGLEPSPPRTVVQTVGYQGNPLYLGIWAKRLDKACRLRGWTFVVNPDDLRNVDILVAFRDGPWDGWICREWKSGVKVVNALAAGRPLLTQASAAFGEIAAPGAIVETEGDLDLALDGWASLDRRQEAYEQARVGAPAYRLSAVADQFRGILDRARANSCVRS